MIASEQFFLNSKYMHFRPFHNVLVCPSCPSSVFKNIFSLHISILAFSINWSSNLSHLFLIHQLSFYQFQWLYFSFLGFLILNKFHISYGILEHTNHSYFKSCLIMQFSNHLCVFSLPLFLLVFGHLILLLNFSYQHKGMLNIL